MDEYIESIAHIKDGDRVFQVLNEDKTDWDETATRALYQAWLADKES